MATKRAFTPYSSTKQLIGKSAGYLFMPPDERDRVATYDKFDQLYWNDPSQYAIRVLEDEEPIYIPNARTIVDTTAQYLLKGLKIVAADEDEELSQDGESKKAVAKTRQKVVDDFLTREGFYGKFHINKQAGITRGDWAFHVTADADKLEGERISIDTLHPGQVFKEWDEEDPTKVIKVNIVELIVDVVDGQDKERVRVLTYERVEEGPSNRRIYREQNVWELSPDWWGEDPNNPPVRVRVELDREALPDQITHIPVYWFNNIDWEGQDYGSSDLRGLEMLAWAVSQGSTDVQATLALEGLGVYATDGGRPVDDDGGESDWEVAPGKVMEVAAGAYFRRVEGVGSITPMMDQIGYLEKKMFMATGMTDVALGQVDVQVAQSGVALAIKFMPTLARIEHRDVAGKELLAQMFHDLISWFEAYDTSITFPPCQIFIAESKLPVNRTDTLNELNNMLDRKIISKKYYRRAVKKLGWDIPEDIDKEITEEAEEDARLKALAAPPGLQQNAADAAAGRKPIPPESNPNNGSIDKGPNQSNNRNRPNESSGTESGQTGARQARGSVASPR